MAYFMAAFLVALGSLGAVATQTSLFIVNSVPVEVQIVNSGSLETAVQQNVAQEIQKNSELFHNKKIWVVSLNKIRDVVVTEPWVESVRISRTLPNHINIVVEPKHALAIVLVQKPKETTPEIEALTEDGSVLKLPSQNVALDATIARGAPFETDQVARKNLIEFIKSLPNDGTLNPKNIAEINYSKTEGFSLSMIPMKSIVMLGSDKIQTKVKRANQVLDYLTAHQLRGRVIDASFSKKVLVRLRKDP